MMLPGYALAAGGTQDSYSSLARSRAVFSGAANTDAVAASAPAVSRIRIASGVLCYRCRWRATTRRRARTLSRVSTFEHTGDSYIIDPRGEIIAGPAEGETILVAEGSMEAVLAAKASCDIGGHYSRPDLLRLIVDRRARRHISEPALNEGGTAAPDASHRESASGRGGDLVRAPKFNPWGETDAAQGGLFLASTGTCQPAGARPPPKAIRTRVAGERTDTIDPVPTFRTKTVHVCVRALVACPSIFTTASARNNAAVTTL